MPPGVSNVNNLGASYMNRFSHLGKLFDLKESIEYQTEAVSLSFNDHPNKTEYLSNLGISQKARFERLGQLLDIRAEDFHLHNGNLTLGAITRCSFKNEGLAFLSACQTATGDKKMPDGAVHLAAGMLMAKYWSLIGTMWSIADEDGSEVADRVYA